MKKAIIMSALAFAFSATSVSTIAQNSDAAIKVNGWDGFTPEPRIIEDKSMDDDASGRSTGSGDARVVKIQKPALSADNTSADINCENSRFAGLCSQLESEMAKRDAQMSASNQSYAQQVALQSENKAKAFADARANQAQNNAINSSKAYSNQKHTDAINHANWKADEAYDKSVEYADGKYDQAIRHSDWRYNQAKDHADWVRSDTRKYANNRANEAQTNSYKYTDQQFAKLNSSSSNLEAGNWYTGWVILNKQKKLIKQWGRKTLRGRGTTKITPSKTMQRIYTANVQAKNGHLNSGGDGTIETSTRISHLGDSYFEVVRGYTGDSKGHVGDVTVYWEIIGMYK